MVLPKSPLTDKLDQVAVIVSAEMFNHKDALMNGRLCSQACTRVASKLAHAKPIKLPYSVGWVIG
mgnify:CR=1 FL=1